jgi:hypothetical protein
MSDKKPPMMIDNHFYNSDIIDDVVTELRRLADLDRVGLAEPTSCQKLVYSILADRIDFDAYEVGE